MSQRVAIIGANGQIGTTLCRAWLGRPDITPVAIVRNRLAEAVLKARVGDALEVRRGSPADPESLAALIRDCDAAINCAYAGGGIRRGRLQNVAIIEGLLAQPNLARVVHLSSVAVYGFGEGYAPTNSYGREKLAHERAAARAASADPRRLTIVRVGHFIGAETAMSRAILEAIFDRAYSLPDLPESASNCVSAPALVSGIERAATDPAAYGIYDLTDLPNPPWSEVFLWHARECGLRPLPPMSREGSSIERNRSRRNASPWLSLIGGAIRAIRAFTGHGALSAPARYYLDAVLAASPEIVESWLRHRHVSRSAARHATPSAGSSDALPEWLFQQPAPGRQLLLGPLMKRGPGGVSLSEWWARSVKPVQHV